MSDTKTEVKLYLEANAPEGLAYINCPECGGSNKLILIPLDDGGTYYKCLRASCETYGSIGTSYRARDAVVAGPLSGRKTYSPYQTHQGLVLDSKVPKYGYIPNLCVGHYYDNHGDTRYILPIRTRHGILRGYVARCWDVKEYKALIRPYDHTGPLLAWYGQRRADQRLIIAVEDQVSAAVMGQYYPCVALLGTSISPDAEKELRQPGERVILILDQDATRQAVKAARRLGIYYLPLTGVDIKDMSVVQLTDLLKRIRTYE